MKAVILAGGKGTRLYPYTIAWPKPLMPLGSHLIIDVVMDQLKYYGITEVYMAVGHLSEIYERYLKNGEAYGIDIYYSHETKPLGTAGPLSLIENLFTDDFIVMNGDVLTSLDYGKFIQHHKDSNALTTIATYRRPVFIPMGCLETDEEKNLTKYEDSPEMHFMVSMGIYVFSPEVKDYIKPNERLDFPDLINFLLEDEKKVMSFPTDAYWLDIGRQEDYDTAVKEFEDRIAEFVPSMR